MAKPPSDPCGSKEVGYGSPQGLSSAPGASWPTAIRFEVCRSPVERRWARGEQASDSIRAIQKNVQRQKRATGAPCSASRVRLYSPLWSMLL